MNSIAASGDMAQRADAAGPRASLKSRIVSAVLLAPVVLGAVYLGGPAFLLLVALAVAIMAWEWQRLCAEGNFGGQGFLFAGVVVCGAILAGFGYVFEASAVVGVGALVVGAVAAREPARSGRLIATGVIAVGLTGIALVWMRGGAAGLSVTIWFLLAVWATDIFAYFTGRAVGGPKLAPSISPNKTWAGLAGGVVAATVWSIGWALWTDGGQPGTLAALGAALAICAQIGDLGVSAVKRRFGAKDSSRLIPGHGGLLDRVDGIIGAAPIAVILVAVSQGDVSSWA